MWNMSVGSRCLDASSVPQVVRPNTSSLSRQEQHISNACGRDAFSDACQHLQTNTFQVLHILKS